jgi:hypothetical protein
MQLSSEAYRQIVDADRFERSVNGTFNSQRLSPIKRVLRDGDNAAQARIGNSERLYNVTVLCEGISDYGDFTALCMLRMKRRLGRVKSRYTRSGDVDG